MFEIQSFSFESHEVRTVIVDGAPYFVGRDVASVLGYTNTTKAIRDHVDAEDKKKNESFSFGRGSSPVIINESGVYSLIFNSKLPAAKAFKRWLTTEVIPQIMHTGSYSVANAQPAGISAEAVAEIMKSMAPVIAGAIADGMKDVLGTVVQNAVDTQMSGITAYLDNMADGFNELREDVKKTQSMRFEQLVPQMRQTVFKQPFISSHDDNLYTTTEIGKSFNMTAAELNIILKNQGVQYRDYEHNCWQLTDRYRNLKWTENTLFTKRGLRGEPDVVVISMKWTKTGLYGLYDLLTDLGYQAVCDAEDTMSVAESRRYFAELKQAILESTI